MIRTTKMNKMLKKNLYIISHQPRLHEAVKAIGTKQGFHAYDTETVADALIDFAKHEPSLVLVDNEVGDTDEVRAFGKLCSMEYCIPLYWLNLQASGLQPSFEHRTAKILLLDELEAELEQLNSSLFHLTANDLAEAVAQNQLALYCQPIVCIKTQQITGAEILLRWQHPLHGLVGPRLFISIANACGMALQIFTWTLQQFLAQTESWEKVKQSISFGFNMAEDLIADDKIHIKLRELTSNLSISQDNIILEIDEPFAANPQYQRNIAQLGESGWTLAIDRFDLHTINLDSLYMSPFKYAKIHKKYISKLELDPKAEFITQQLARIGHQYDLKIVAVGVESASHWNKVGSYGCDFAQGFYISQPIPLPSFKNWLIK